ncbi:programmed cell death protein 2 [Zopfochytrium polystomum]|nr:programmed cell death protein 2 [Zopfochytrium polystomum]
MPPAAAVKLGFVEPLRPEDYVADRSLANGGTLDPSKLGVLSAVDSVGDFPHKVGGLPLWLHRTRPLSSDEVLCGSCGSIMPLLLQLYTPSDRTPSAYLRVVYVFACKDGACHKKSQADAFKFFRSQLPQHNPIWPPDTASDDEADEAKISAPLEPLAPTCLVCGLAAPKTCGACRRARTLDWTSGGHKVHCARSSTSSFPASSVSSSSSSSSATSTETDADRQRRDGMARVRAAALFPETEVVTEDEPERGGGGAAGLAAGVARVTVADRDDMDGGEAGAAAVDYYDMDETEVDVDATFLKFQKRVEIEPQQVLRCAAARLVQDGDDADDDDAAAGAPAQPLWVAEGGQLAPDAVPPCPHCGAARTFEFQIMPQLLVHLKIDDSKPDALDWGTVAFYSCSASCQPTDAATAAVPYVRELVHPQAFSAAGMGDSVRRAMQQQRQAAAAAAGGGDDDDDMEV